MASCGLWRALGSAVVLGLLTTGRAAAFGSCLAPGYLDQFVAGLAPQPCDEIHRTTVATAHGNSALRLIRLSASSHGDDAVWRGHVDALAAALGPALDAMEAPRLSREITVLLTDATDLAPGLGEVHADTWSASGGECRVSFFKLSDGATTEAFVFTLAHEIFHCAQYETWPDATAPGQDDWWAEGSAEYFANLALPGTGQSAGWLDAFDTNSVSTDLTGMAYENVVFFSWLGNRSGPAGVGRFLAAMRPGDQISVLRGLVPLEDWVGFVETWLDGGVSLPGGAAIRPAPMAAGLRRFGPSGEIELAARPYQIERWGAAFAEGGRYALDLFAEGAATSHAAMRPMDGGGWAPPPPTLSTCAGEQTHIVYLAAVDGPAEAVLEVQADEDRTGGTCCLIGDWSPTQEALDGLAATATSFGAPALAAAGGSFSCRYESGGWVLSFRDDGTGALTFEANANTCVASGGGGTMRQSLVRDGSIGFGWRVIGEGGAQVYYTENTVSWLMTLTIGPMRQEHGGADAGPSTPLAGFAFSCDGDDLTVQGIYGLGSAEWPHVRFTAE